MTRNKIFYLSAFVFILSMLAVGIYTLASPSWAVPRTLHYHGRLSDISGDPVEGTHDVTFRIWDEETASEAEHKLWEETLSVTFEEGGFCSVELGAASGHEFPDTLFEGDRRWLGVQIEGDTEELSPRHKIHSVPYALSAGESAALAEGADIDNAMIDGTSVAETMAALEARIAALESPAPSCPDHAGEMVLVGRPDNSHASFCIDKFEISVWSNPECTTGQRGIAGDDYDDFGFFDNGNYDTPHYGCSKSDVIPSRYLTWFQAQQACILSGKRMCTNAEWQAAVAGTPDTASCNIYGSSVQATGRGTACVSHYGAEDMIGNLREWVTPWVVAGPQEAIETGAEHTPWPEGYGNDATWNIGGGSWNSTSWQQGLPSAFRRGGRWDRGEEAGAFSLHLTDGPSAWREESGTRCCAPVIR